MVLLESTAAGDLLSARTPSMTLLSAPVCVFSHCCRIVLLEKDVECSIEYVSARDDPARLGESNPYGETPTLLDRELTLYGTSVVIEYLDERFPHPPLMPVDPIARAKTRLMIMRLSRDWLTPISELEVAEALIGMGAKKSGAPAALKRSIRDGLLALSPLFAQQPFFLSDEYTVADAYFTPLLWRLLALGVQLPSPADALLAYGERMFKRPAFAASLSPQEATLR
ncbi:MAG: glutathione S-transferase N-terminal domain-containing protein [bacterium]